MKKFKRLLLISLVAGSMGSSLVYANEIVPIDERLNVEQSFSTENISQAELDMLFTSFTDQIIKDYSELYDLDNFSYEYTLRNENNIVYIDMDIYVDMTLTRHPSESPYIEGMLQALNEENDPTKKEVIQSEIDSFIERVENESYKIKDKSTFTYTVLLENTNTTYSLDINTLPVYYRYNVGDEVILIEESELQDVEDSSIHKKNGYTFAKEQLQQDEELSSVTPYASFTYNRLTARDWALDNAFATPEYPSSEVPGTDCANFVSKALNKGGIPQDKSGKWYGSSYWGGWPGDHWFRTGDNGSTGVVIYMKNKGYFNIETNEAKVAAGSIMYWNKASHVALVTYGDGSTIKYTEHGAKQSANTVYKSPSTPATINASFYTPSSSIQ